MTTEYKPAVSPDRRLDVTPEGAPGVVTAERVPSRSAAQLGGRMLAALRIGTGFVFLWAFLDKLFGFGYATPSDGAWINGGSPTEGFLSNLQAGPLRDMFTGWAGAGWADWLFMAALAGVGIALLLGVGLRVAAGAGSLLMAGMWLAEWPLARFGFSGDPTMSTNPLVDYHVIYALVLIVCAVAYAGRTWGFGRMWERLAVVRRNRWLI